MKVRFLVGMGREDGQHDRMTSFKRLAVCRVGEMPGRRASAHEKGKEDVTSSRLAKWDNEGLESLAAEDGDKLFNT